MTFDGVFVPGGDEVDVTVTTGSTGGLLDAWIDWNSDGDWADAGEQIATSVAIGASGTEVLSVQAPIGAAEAASCARFRFSTAGGLSSTGLAADGEIEDYSVAIGAEDPIIGAAKELISVTTLGNNSFGVLFQVLVENLSNVKLSEVQVVQDLAAAFADAEEGFEVDFVESMDFTVNPGFDGDGDTNLLDGADMLEIGDSGTILVQVTLRPGSNAGPYFCSAAVMAVSPADTPVTDLSQDGGDSDPDNNGDPGDNDQPTELLLTISPIDIPTLSGWAMALLATILLTLALSVMRRQRITISER